MFNPMSMATPQQRAELEKMQVFTQKIRCTIHTEKSSVEIKLSTDDAEAQTLIPQLVEGVVTSVTQMLYTMFNVSGERV